MSSSGMGRPYVVAAFFLGSDGQSQTSVSMEVAANTENAAVNPVARYYLGGGKLTCCGTSVLAVTREQAEMALKLLDAIDEADKAEQAKVVSLIPNVPDQNDPVHGAPTGDIAS